MVFTILTKHGLKCYPKIVKKYTKIALISFVLTNSTKIKYTNCLSIFHTML